MIPTGKADILLREYVADTNPHDLNSIFRILELRYGASPQIRVSPHSARRVYTLQKKTNLADTVWSNVEGQIRVPGGETNLTDSATPGPAFYRVIVEVP